MTKIISFILIKQSMLRSLRYFSLQKYLKINDISKVAVELILTEYALAKTSNRFVSISGFRFSYSMEYRKFVSVGYFSVFEKLMAISYIGTIVEMICARLTCMQKIEATKLCVLNILEAKLMKR